MKLKSLLLLAALLGALYTQSISQDNMAKSNQQAKSVKKKFTKSIQVNYLLYLPADYQQRGSKRWPLILFLHGSGERGTNLNLVTVHGPPKIVKSKPEFPFIVGSPQCPPGERWDNDALLVLLDEIIAKYKVDKTRIYLTGLSMGGYGTWSLG